MKPDKIPNTLPPSKPKKRVDDWVKHTLADARDIYAKYQRGLRAGWVQVEDALAHGLPLEVFRRRHQLLWVIQGGRAGAGFLRWNSKAKRWEVRRAYLTPELRGQRSYEKILLNLRVWMGYPIASDIQLSTAATTVWKRVGVYDRAANRYIKNPPPGALRLTKNEKEAYREALNYYATQARPRK